jgi:hypothetical protein
MQLRAILDMKLGLNGSELDGHVGVSSFLTRIHQLLRQLLWSVLDVWGRGAETGGFLCDPRAGQSWMSIDLAIAYFHNNTLIRYRLAHSHSRHERSTPKPHRMAYCTASSPNKPIHFYLDLTFFAALAFPSALVDNIFVHTPGFFRTLTTYSSFF